MLLLLLEFQVDLPLYIGLGNTQQDRMFCNHSGIKTPSLYKIIIAYLNDKNNLAELE